MKDNPQQLVVLDQGKFFSGFHRISVRRVVATLPRQLLGGSEGDVDLFQDSFHLCALVNPVQIANILAQRFLGFVWQVERRNQLLDLLAEFLPDRSI